MRKRLCAVVISLGLVGILAADGRTQPPGMPAPPEPGTVLPPFARDAVKLSKGQEKELADLEKDVKGKLAKVLTDKQIKLFNDTLRQGPPAGPPPGGPPPGMEPGLVIPPFVYEKLKLTDKQESQVADLEKEARDGLGKLLTEDQMKKFEEAMRRGPGGPPGKDRPEKKKAEAEPSNTPAGIQWFASLNAGRDEAARTGRPILLVSAAPHCGGVSGIW